jgi:regulatory protein
MSRTITALEVQKNNPERINVYLDGAFAFGLPLVEAAYLHTGQTLSEDEITSLQAVDTAARALDQAVKLLARRPHSTAEIVRYLESKKVPSAAIDETLAKLEHLGYLDDRAFVEFWIENRERFRPRGPRALRYELRQKGVAGDLIDSVLAGLDARGSAYRAAQEKVRRLRGLTPEQFRNRLGAFLAQRGFGYDIAREVIDQLISELNDHETGFFADEE